MSIVPENKISRRFRDLAGRVNQLIADACDEVVLVVCGQPLKIKTPIL
jgi:adenosylcobinamide kinase/adenosylcobinamide-phosphate guanylyltransferase